ncbi:MAG: ribosome bioproteinis GTP-binding protein YsxC/EngB [Erysipelotrichaceae bacterium]|jgi:GTP-binding protein|nr:MAG: ribosome bioproteinis GTP-binding protein [Erysipelotrichaceae bacterium]TXT17211.1 MAG: ribosome bioproteinis GTP-binding protein YsxC/EngB [Erysipelotrichaceae bacterium]
MAGFQQAVFVTTAVSKTGFALTDLPELVLAGRSNVGKSSFINALCRQKSLAYVGKRPGKTRYINFYQVEELISMVDVPGYGYANRSKSELKAYGTLMEDYFNTRQNIKAVILVIDSRHGLTSDDEDMLNYVTEKKLPLLIVATKSDKLTQSEKMKTNKELQLRFGSNVILFSALRHLGIEEVENWIMNKIKT